MNIRDLRKLIASLPDSAQVRCLGSIKAVAVTDSGDVYLTDCPTVARSLPMVIGADRNVEWAEEVWRADQEKEAHAD